MEEAKKMKCYKRVIYKQFCQVSGLCDPQFLSYLRKRFTHLSVGRCWHTNMAVGNQQKRLEFTFPIKALSFHSRTSILAHKRMFQYLKWLYCWKSRGDSETFLFQRESIPILVSCTVTTWKFKLLYFRNETFYGTGNLYK